MGKNYSLHCMENNGNTNSHEHALVFVVLFVNFSFIAIVPEVQGIQDAKKAKLYSRLGKEVVSA